MIRKLVSHVAGFSTHTIKRDSRRDNAFKAVFMDKTALKSLLSALYDTRIMELDYLSSYLHTPEERSVRFDLRVKDLSGSEFIVQFEKAVVDEPMSRWIHNAARGYCTQKTLQPAEKRKSVKKSQLKSMEFYIGLLPVRTVVLCDAPNAEAAKMLDTFLPHDRVVSDFHISCVQTGTSSQEMAWKFVRLDLFVQLVRNGEGVLSNNLNSTCIEWLKLLTSGESDEVNVQAVEDEGVRRGYEILSMDPHQMSPQELRDYLIDQAAKQEMRGTAEQIAVAKIPNLLAAGRYVEKRRLSGQDTSEEELMRAYELTHPESAAVLAVMAVSAKK